MIYHSTNISDWKRLMAYIRILKNKMAMSYIKIKKKIRPGGLN